MTKLNMIIETAKVEIATDPGTIAAVLANGSNLASIITSLDALTFTAYARCIDAFGNIGPKEVSKVKYSTGEIDSYAELGSDAGFTWAENFNADDVNRFLGLATADVVGSPNYTAIGGNNGDVMTLPKLVLRIGSADGKKRIYITGATVTEVFNFAFDKVTNERPKGTTVKLDGNDGRVILKEVTS